MAANHLYVRGLSRPMSLSEYAKLEGVPEAEVLALVRALKIPAAFFQGQWYVEAPPNSEQRCGQPRAADTQNTKTNEEKQRDLDAERLRVQFLNAHWRYDRLTTTQQQALLNTKAYAEHPQPIDYGLSRYDVCGHGGGYPLHDDLTYREEQLHEWRWIILMAFVIYACACGGMLYLHDSGHLEGTSSEILLLALVLAPTSVMVSLFYLFPIVERFADLRRVRRSKPGYLRYQEALELHQLYKSTAQAAVHEAEQGLLRKKRSYWAFLDGYEFERATAEVLKKYQFNPRVTPGSADGGVDIEVARAGLKGVVQCKAHVACIGPHVVRDFTA